MPYDSVWESKYIPPQLKALDATGVHVCGFAHINRSDPETGFSHQANVETYDPSQGRFWLVSLRLQ